MVTYMKSHYDWRYHQQELSACMNQPVATSMRDDYVDKAKQPTGVPASTRQVLTSIHLYIAIQLKACLMTT